MKKLWNRIKCLVCPPYLEHRIKLYAVEVRRDRWQTIYSICTKRGGEVALIKILHDEKRCWVGFTHAFDDVDMAESVILKAKCLFLDHSINL